MGCTSCRLRDSGAYSKREGSVELSISTLESSPELIARQPKKVNWPPDGRQIWAWNSRSVWEDLRRRIQAQKFYKTLPSKIRQAENDWLDTQPSNQIPKPELIEHEPDGSEAQRLLGGALQLKSDFVEDDNLPTGKTG